VFVCVQIDRLKFSDDLATGPIQNRSITDILFGAFFILFCCGMVAASIYGYYMGDPRLLLIGWDSEQKGCGYSTITQDYPYLYFPQSPSTDQVTQI